MTLKELRTSKGLTQIKAASFLGMTTRNYQIYETNKDKINSARYNAIYSKLESYGQKEEISSSFYTNIIKGKELLSFYKQVKKYKKRDCFKLLKDYIDNDYPGKVCILYGLRRTGKTTLLFQLLGEIDLSKVAYIKVKSSDSMANLSKDLSSLRDLGISYVLIDEITLMEDFINTAAILSDIYTNLGMKIILSGTDSLGFAMASRDELYDRNIMIHTSFISFREYSRLLSIKSIDSYIEYGGTLKIENMGLEEYESSLEDASFKDDESTRKYIDTSISKNIQRTLKNDRYGEYLNKLRELYDKNELTNVINRIVEDMNHGFLLKVVEDEFKSHDLGSSRDLLLHDVPLKRAYVLDEVDKEGVISRLKSIIEVKEKEECDVAISAEEIEQIKNYLIMLDLIVNIPINYEKANPTDYYVFTQPGMRYSLAKALVYSLLQDNYFSSISIEDKKYIIDKILNDVKGRMMEDIILLEVNKSKKTKGKAFKYKFLGEGEFDMVAADDSSLTSKVYEIKHSDKIVSNQTRYLLDKDKIDQVSFRFGKVIKKSVIYRGVTTKVGDIEYKNVEEFLLEL